MQFTDYQFLGLLLFALPIYYLLRSTKQQLSMLIVTSFVFYSAANPWLSILLFSSMLVNWWCSKSIIESKNDSHRWAFLICGVIFNLVYLGIFKYANFIVQSLSEISSFHLWNESAFEIPLPVGISFYTFQGVSLVVDLYRKKQSSSTSTTEEGSFGLLNVLHYISFFPQLVAGPIVKANEFLPQIRRKFVKDIDLQFCFCMLVQGYFLKSFVADNLKDYTFWMQAPYYNLVPTWQLQVMPFAYSCQIFADFAGYSMIAMGLGGLFGYRLPVNFDAPYMSCGFQEFWRRWHISLSSWLREYLYIPLGGNRCSKIRNGFNLMIVMTLGGLWHGAAWRYVLWGALHGALLFIERAFFNRSKTDQKLSRFKRIMGIIVTFVIVSYIWLFFQLDSPSDVWNYTVLMCSPWEKCPSLKSLFPYLYFQFPVLVLHLNRELTHNQKTESNRSKLLRSAAYGVMLYLLIFDHGSSTTFIYFQF